MHPTNIDWHSNESHIFINPRMPSFEKNKLNHMIQEFKLHSHIFLATSGSTAIQSSDVKWVSLKKLAFLASAQGVNSHLNCSKNDVFLNTLPHFHVGGLSLFARASLCEARIVDLYSENYKWDPQQYVHQLTTNNITISSLVPTQVYDLVQNNLTAPTSVKALVVGGGFLNKNLYNHAKELGWPLLPSYGMTECGSQVATALPNFSWNSNYPELTVLPHLQVTLSNENRIEIKGESLLTGYILQSQDKVEFVDPKVDGKVVTSDLGEFKNNKLLVYGRNDENVKINGENVSLIRLQSILQQVCKIDFDCAIISLPDPRQGQKIAAVFSSRSKEYNSLNKLDKNEIFEITQHFNEIVFPFERITGTYFVDHIPRTELGKLKRNLIAKLLDIT